MLNLQVASRLRRPLIKLLDCREPHLVCSGRRSHCRILTKSRMYRLEALHTFNSYFKQTAIHVTRAKIWRCKINASNVFKFKESLMYICCSLCPHPHLLHPCHSRCRNLYRMQKMQGPVKSSFFTTNTAMEQHTCLMRSLLSFRLSSKANLLVVL